MKDQEEKTTEYHVQDNSDIEGSVLAAAKNHYNQGNYKEALKLYIDAIHRNSDPDIYVDIGNCFYMMKDQKEAIEYWTRATELDPKNSKAYANLGNLHYKNDHVDQAISYWLQALVTRPEDATTCLNLAIAFNEKMMRFESIKYFEKYIKYAEDKFSEDYLKIKNKVQNCFNVANEYLKAGVKAQLDNDDKQAAACYFKSLANYPNLSKTNLNLGSIFFSDKNLELAIKYWKVSANIDPNYAKSYSNLAISYDLLKEFDYAYCYYYRYMNYVINDKEEYYKVNRRLVKLKEYVAKHPNLITRHLELAKEHVANSQIYDAIDEFKNYSLLKPEEKDLYKDTIKKLESYLNPEIEIIANCFETGDKLIKEGKFAEAKPYFQRIMVLSSPKYLEFSKAKAKYSQCEKAE